MALRKAVFAEASDLREAVLGEGAVVATRHHAVHHPALELVDGADMTEGGHGTTQLVRLFGRELRGLDRDPHRLLLKERHAQGLAQHVLQLIGGPMLGCRAYLGFADLLAPRRVVSASL